MDVGTFCCLASLWFLASGLAGVFAAWVVPANGL